MASKRFCDCCDRPIVVADDAPYIRYHPTLNLKVACMFTDHGNNVAQDVCSSCKLDVLINGLIERPSHEQVAGEPMSKVIIPELNSRPVVGGGGNPTIETPESVYVPSLTKEEVDGSKKKPAKKPKGEQG